MTTSGNGSVLSVAGSPESEDGPLSVTQVADRVVSEISRGPLPLPCGRTDLVLRRKGAGQIAVQWHLEPRDLQAIRGAFPADVDPTPVIRLIRLIGPGQGATVACAPLGHAALSSDGGISFDVADDGVAVQAELGLEAPGGGWLMVARSNPATSSSRGARALPKLSAPEVDSARADPTLAAAGADLMPVFPEVDLEGALSRLAPGDSAPPCFDSASDGKADREAKSSTPATARSAYDSASLNRKPDDAVGADEIRSDGGSDHGQPMGIAPEGDPISVPDDAALYPARRRGSSYGNAEPRYGVGEDGALAVYAELLVHGRAKPGSEIDLFGHRIPIGPGGRFSLRLPVPNSELLKQALDLGLPLVSRRRIEP